MSTPEQDGWATGWRLTASVVLVRTLLLVLLGLTPVGPALLAPLDALGPDLAPTAAAVVIVLLAWLPGRLARPARARVHRQVPALRPLPATGPALGRFAIGLMVAALLLFVTAPVSGPVLVLAGLGYLAGLALVVVQRRRGAAGLVLPDGTLPPEQGTDRLAAALASLGWTGPPVTAVVGRLPGRAVNAWMLRNRGRNTLVVAPELLTRLDDAELRALVAHELGHTGPTAFRRRRVALFVLVLAVAGLALAVPPDPPGRPLAVGYLAFLVLRPVVLGVLRAEEAAADRTMLQLTGDPEGCAGFLARQPEIFGLPWRWTVAQRLLVATHPAVADRVAAVRAPAVGGRS